MSHIAQTIISQYLALAPRGLRYDNRQFNAKNVIKDGDKVRFDYISRKRGAAITADKLTIMVELNGWDLYDTTVTYCNGETLSNTVIKEMIGGQGAYFDMFERVQDWI